VPSAVVTVTSTVPQPGGAVAVSWLGEETVTFEAALAPNWTDDPVVKSAPVTVTSVDPPLCSEVGLIAVTVGAEKVSLPANVAQAQPVSAGDPIAAYSPATQTSVGF
jgi:hypothetical protein